jgi:hypothetical protein
MCVHVDANPLVLYYNVCWTEGDRHVYVQYVTYVCVYIYILQLCKKKCLVLSCRAHDHDGPALNFSPLWFLSRPCLVFRQKSCTSTDSLSFFSPKRWWNQANWVIPTRSSCTWSSRSCMPLLESTEIYPQGSVIPGPDSWSSNKLSQGIGSNSIQNTNPNKRLVSHIIYRASNH